MLILHEDINVVHEEVQIENLCTLHHLRRSMKSLLRTKQKLTSEWAESVDFIIEDLSRVCSNSQPLKNSCSSHEAYISREYIEDDVRRLEGELEKLQARFKVEDAERIRSLHKYLDLKGNMRVFCRIRPIVSKEGKKVRPLVSNDGKKSLGIRGTIVTPTLHDIHIVASRNKKVYQFDKVFLPSSTQEDVFAEVGPLVRSVLDGINICIFAYGQTGAGKTFTVEGTEKSPGIVPRSLQLLFHQSSLDMNKNYLITFSMLELYMGSLRDLLVPLSQQTARQHSHKSLSIQMNFNGWVEVDNLSEFVVKDAKQARELYEIGSQARSTACTNSNRVSSRSHCLIRITVASSGQSSENPVMSKLWLIDLGGSERLLKTNAKGKLLEEGKAINLSLTALGDVINALQNRQPHVPYRNSKLTQVLRDSLGKDAKTVMLVHVSQREEDVNETVCSLNFAMRAKTIHLGKEVSSHEREQKELEMEEIRKQLDRHEGNCEYLRDNIRELEFLCKKKKEMLIKKERQEEMLMKKERQEREILTLQCCEEEKQDDCHCRGLGEDPIVVPPIGRNETPNKSPLNSRKRNAVSLELHKPRRFMATTTSSRIKASCKADAKLVSLDLKIAQRNASPPVAQNILSIKSSKRAAKFSSLMIDMDTHLNNHLLNDDDDTKHDDYYVQNGSRRVHDSTKHDDDYVQNRTRRVHDRTKHVNGCVEIESRSIDDATKHEDGSIGNGSRTIHEELSRPCLVTEPNCVTPFKKTTMVIKMARTSPLANITRGKVLDHLSLEYLLTGKGNEN